MTGLWALLRIQKGDKRHAKTCHAQVRIQVRILAKEGKRESVRTDNGAQAQALAAAGWRGCCTAHTATVSTRTVW